MADQQQNLLRRIPPEIRDQIFAPCLLRSRFSTTSPELLVALRPDRLLYEEALDLFYKQNVFSITFKQFGAVPLFEGLKDDIVPRIKSLRLTSFGARGADNKAFIAKLRLATGLETLVFLIFERDSLADMILKTILEHHKNLKRLTFRIVLDYVYTQSILRRFERRLGFKGREETGPRGQPLGSWIWEAGDGGSIFPPRSS